MQWPISCAITVVRYCTLGLEPKAAGLEFKVIGDGGFPFASGKPADCPNITPPPETPPRSLPTILILAPELTLWKVNLRPFVLYLATALSVAVTKTWLKPLHETVITRGKPVIRFVVRYCSVLAILKIGPLTG